MCVCGSIDGLMVCVCVCVVMSLDRWIGGSVYHRSLCVWLCVLKPVLEVEGEREEKEKKKRNS